MEDEKQTRKNRKEKVMNNNEELVTNVTENVEEVTTEENLGEAIETPKTYTEEELNARVDELLAKKIARKEAKIRKEYETKYSDYKEAESVLNAGLGTSNIKEATENLREFYTNKGVSIPKYEPTYNEYDMRAGAEREANEIIESGFDEVVEEVDRLAELGLDNMTPRERLVFEKLAGYRKSEQDRKELAKIGVNETALQDNDFIEFAKDLNPNMSTKDKYEKYLKYRPKPEVETIGSMKNNTSNDTGVKDFYSRDEAMKFTKKDLDKNPALLKAIENSMLKW
jgi:hypothetical protein